MADSPKPNPTAQNSGALPGPLAPGTVLQRRYEIVRLLGGGGMGMVYLAYDQRLSQRPCAIKEMVDHFIDPQQRIEANQYFAQEADTLAQLKHPAIPAISDRFDDQNRHYLVMEYVAGRNLEEELAARGGPLPEGLVIDVARQVSEVLGYLHGLNPPLIYRDMKPSNVMLTAAGRAVLVDFGIARLFKAQRKGTMIGTLGFAPPEQYQGIADPRSDIYSLGATLHYVLTGRDPEKFPPFSFPPVRELRPEASRNLAGAIDRALAYDMSGRPATIGEFRDMLLYGRGLEVAGPVVSSRGGTAGLTLRSVLAEEPELPPVARRRSVSRRRPVRTLAVLSVMLGGLAFGATYVYQDPQLQDRLGLTQFIDQLPWKHAELLAAAEKHPLQFERMTLALATREGDPLGPPKASFTDLELTTNRYLKWQATFDNALAKLGERLSGPVEARFYDPAGNQIAKSKDDRFIGPNEAVADFGGVVMIPDTDGVKAGNYRVALYQNDQIVGQSMFGVTEDLAAKAASVRAKAEADAAAATAARNEELKREEDERRLAMLEERRRRPLQLESIEFINSTKDGTALSGPTNTFSVSKVLYVGWRTVFANRLYGLIANQYSVDAAYVGPDGSALGSVNNVQNVPPGATRAVFTGRVGNSAGGAFVPGTYTVNFYLNGQPVAQRRFRVVADAGVPGGGYGPAGGSYSGGGGGGGSSYGGSTTGADMPTLATGTISGIGGFGSATLELRLRPQPNGFLDGEMVVGVAGYGTTAIQGFVRGAHLEFQVAYGANTFDFEGARNGDTFNGTFDATPSGQHGTWTATSN